MEMQDLFGNPCRFTIFDVFLIDKSETDLRKIREAMRQARDKIKYGQLTARDGTEFSISEAQMNVLEKILLDPVQRLKAEQFVHQQHSFSDAEDLKMCLDKLSESDFDLVQESLSSIQKRFSESMNQLLPPIQPDSAMDDLPWPEFPLPREIVRENMQATILRDH